MTTDKMTEPLAITLWRDNKISGRWDIDLDELATRFAASKWANYEWPLDRSVATFIGDPEDGLSSVFDHSNFATIVRACSAAIYKSTRVRR